MPSLCLLSDAIGPQGGKVMTTTPFDEAMAKRRSDVTPDFVLIYTVVGYPVRSKLQAHERLAQLRTRPILTSFVLSTPNLLVQVRRRLRLPGHP